MDTERVQENKGLVNKQIFIYLAVTFIITYAVEIGGLYPLYKQVSSITNIDEGTLSAFNNLLSFVLWIPSIGVVITKLLTREGIKLTDLHLGFNSKRFGRYYLFAWFGTIGLIVVGSLAYYIVFPHNFDLGMGRLSTAYAAVGQTVTGETIFVELVIGAFIAPVLNLLSCFGEEWGFRGYLLPVLLKRFKVIPAIIISGLLWGIWNAPLVAMGYNYGEGYLGFPFTGIIAMCIYCVVIGTVFSFLCIKTGSCIPAILAHAVINGFAGVSNLFLPADAVVSSFTGPMPTGVMGGIGFIAAAVVMIALLIQDEKKKQEG